MKGIAKLVNEYLKKKLDITIYNDVFADDKAGATDIICRYDPSEAAERRFIDGTRRVEEQLSFYCRSPNATQARDTLDDIIKTLDNHHILRIDDDRLICQCEAVTLPQFVDMSDSGKTTYTCTVKIIYRE
jgi:hypothetical protein